MFSRRAVAQPESWPLRQWQLCLDALGGRVDRCRFVRTASVEGGSRGSELLTGRLGDRIRESGKSEQGLGRRWADEARAEPSHVRIGTTAGGGYRGHADDPDASRSDRRPQRGSLSNVRQHPTERIARNRFGRGAGTTGDSRNPPSRCLRADRCAAAAIDQVLSRTGRQSGR